MTNRWRRQTPTQTRAVFNIDDDAIVNRLSDLEGELKFFGFSCAVVDRLLDLEGKLTIDKYYCAVACTFF